MTWSLPYLLLTLSAAQPIAGEPFSRDVRRNASNATVQIANTTQRCVGSGVIIRNDNGTVYILTAGHVAQHGDTIEVRFFTPRSHPKPDSVHRSVTILASGKGSADLALLRLSTGKAVPTALRLCSPEQAPREKSLPVLTVGCNGELAPSAVEGRTRKKTVRLSKEKDPVTLWEVEKDQQTGRSGGPMVDKRGLILGICSGKAEGRGYFCTAEQIQEFLKDHKVEWLAEDK